MYYGNAIRANNSSVDEMRKAIWAIWYHKQSSDENIVHSFCPQGIDSWCPYQKAMVEGTIQGYRHKNSLAPAIMEAIVATELLKRCVGGHTQNNNESFH